jgi:hypothetical protein
MVIVKKSKLSEKADWIKYSIFTISILFNICLVLFPNLIPSKIQDRVLISFIMFNVVGIGFSLESLRLSLSENHNEIITYLDQENQKIDDLIVMTKISQSLREVEQTEDEIFYTHAKLLIENLNKKLEQAAIGEISLDPTELISIPLKLAESVQKSLKATVLFRIDTLQGTVRERYLQLLDKAAKERNVSVQRLFIINAGDEASQEFQERVEKDIKNGVNVRWLLIEEWISTGNNGIQASDFGIWDDQKVWYYRYEQGIRLKNGVAFLCRNKQTILQYERAFLANWERANLKNGS